MRVHAGLDLSSGSRSAIDAARSAEREGYDVVTSSETAHDPFLPLLPVAQATTTIELGTAIAVAFARNPMNTAMVAWDLHAESNGRFTLGLGSQVRAHIERRFSMPWGSPTKRMREYISAVRAIWGSWQDHSRLDFQGDFYHHTLMTPFFDPGPLPFRPPRIALAAVGPAMTAVAGELADGLLAHPFTTPTYLREVTLAALADGRRRAGRDADAVSVHAPVFVICGVDDEAIAEAREATRRQLAFYASTPSYMPVLEMHGWGDAQQEAQALVREARWEALGHLIDDSMLDTFAVTGDAPGVGERIVERLADVADSVSLEAPYALADDLRTEIICAIRSAAQAHEQRRLERRPT